MRHQKSRHFRTEIVQDLVRNSRAAFEKGTEVPQIVDHVFRFRWVH